MINYVSEHRNINLQRFTFGVIRKFMYSVCQSSFSADINLHSPLPNSSMYHFNYLNCAKLGNTKLRLYPVFIAIFEFYFANINCTLTPSPSIITQFRGVFTQIKQFSILTVLLRVFLIKYWRFMRTRSPKCHYFAKLLHEFRF